MQLLGLYTGVPFTQWGRGYYQGPPDTIHIYRLPIMADAHTPAEIKEKVRAVVRHEIGHRAGWVRSACVSLASTSGRAAEASLTA